MAREPLLHESTRGGHDIVALCAAISAGFGSFSFGFSLGFTSPAQSLLVGEYCNQSPCLNEQEFAVFSGVVTLGAMVGAVSGGPLNDAIGRRGGLQLSSVPLILGWTLQIFGMSFMELVGGRALVGFGIGVISCVVPLYISETAPNYLRGALGGVHQLMITMGTLGVYLLGIRDLHLGWRQLAMGGVVPALTLLITISMLPETPFWLAQSGRKEGAKRALKTLRFSDDVESELENITDWTARRTQGRVTVVHLCHSDVSPGLFVACGAMILQQASGINCIIFYSDEILTSAGVKRADWAAIYVGVLQVLSTFFAVCTVEQAGRRLLMIVSSFGMAVMCFFLGLCYHFGRELGSYRDPAAIVSVLGIIVFFSVGLGSVPWLLMAEVIPSRVRGMGSGLATVLNWLTAFLITTFFDNLASLLSTGGSFYLFAVVCGVGVFFSTTFLPETKGRSFEEIQSLLVGGPVPG